MATSCTPLPCPTEIGACCLEDLYCVVLGVEECGIEGGTYLGGDEACEVETCYGACCDDTGSCFVFRRDLCESNDGIFFGAGSRCLDISCDPAGHPVTHFPTALQLGSPHPNPTSDRFTISFGLPWSSEVRLAIYDVRGAEIEVILAESRNAGWHDVNWDVSRESDLASGIYFVKLTTGRETRTRQIVVAR
jgi:hypothetical protein